MDKKSIGTFTLGSLRSSMVFRAVKKLLMATVFREGAVRTVLWGPCRGLRYRIFPSYGLAYLYGGWELQSTRLMTKYVKPGGVVYDLGANYGMHTLLLAKLVGPSGRVFAFEPNPEIMAALTEQIALNDLSMVRTVPVAVSDRVGSARFERGDHGGAGHLCAEESIRATNTFDVETTTLDKFVFQDGNPAPSFIKIDIEGAESAALRGSVKVMEQHKPLLLIELHNCTEDRAVGQILKRFAYMAFQIDSGRAVVDMERGRPDPLGMSGTVIALPRAGVR